MANSKTNAELLHAVKRDNKTSREKRAILLGYKSSVELIAFLEKEISAGRGGSVFSGTSTPASKPKTPKQVKETFGKTRPLIHVVDVLDASGSMAGGKFAAAIKGINTGITQLKKDKANVDYTYTLCDFSDDILFKHILALLANITVVKGSTRGSTALFDAIGKTVEVVKGGWVPGHKVLVNVYTDGQENSSRFFTQGAIATLIESLSPQGWTFTFIGTEQDTKYAQNLLKFDSSNTLVYDGTAKGLERSFVANTSAREVYSQKVSLGEDVSTGFYKDIN